MSGLRPKRCHNIVPAAVALAVGGLFPQSTGAAPGVSFDPEKPLTIVLKSRGGRFVEASLIDFDPAKRRAKVRRKKDRRLFWVELADLADSSAQAVESWGLKQQAALGFHVTAKQIDGTGSDTRRMFEVTVSNRSRADLKDIRLEYFLVRRVNEAAEKRRRRSRLDPRLYESPTPGVSRIHPIKQLPPGSDYTFRTTGLIATPGRGLKGIWCRVYYDNVLVEEWSSPAGIIESESWLAPFPDTETETPKPIPE